MDLGIGSRVSHKEFGVGVVIQVTGEHFVITFVNYGVKEIARLYADDELEVLERAAPIKGLVSLAEVEIVLETIVSRVTDELDTTDLNDKWLDGKLILQPGNTDLQAYELPLETFFHKIVMIRDRLRVMEQRINSSALNEQEKVNLQQYITKIYGSLTSFNVLFKSRESGFVGSSGG